MIIIQTVMIMTMSINDKNNIKESDNKDDDVINKNINNSDNKDPNDKKM